jgi:hypothetical protein
MANGPSHPLRAIAVSVMIGLAMTPSTAHAYIDPTTGSFVFQAVLGVLASIGVLIKFNWTRLRNLFRRRRKPDPRDP